MKFLSVILCIIFLLGCNEAILSAEEKLAQDIIYVEKRLTDGWWVEESDSLRTLYFRFEENKNAEIIYETDYGFSRYSFMYEILSLDEVVFEDKTWVIQELSYDVLLLSEKVGERLYVMSKSYMGPFQQNQLILELYIRIF